MEKENTKLSLTNYRHTLTWEREGSDVDIEELLNAFYALCIGATFLPETVLTGMKDFAEERLGSFKSEDDE